MPYESSWSESIVVKRFWGFVTAPEFIKSVEQVAADDRYDELHFIVNDLIDMEGFSVHAADIDYVTAIHFGGVQSNHHLCIVLITTDDMLLKLADKISRDVYKRPHQIQVFPTRDVARCWLLTHSVLEKFSGLEN